MDSSVSFNKRMQRLSPPPQPTSGMFPPPSKLPPLPLACNPAPPWVPQPLVPSATGDRGALFRSHGKSDAVCARLCLVHMSLACVVSVTEHYSVECRHQDSYSAHSFDGCWSIKRVALSILLTLFLKEHSFKILIKCIFFSFSLSFTSSMFGVLSKKASAAPSPRNTLKCPEKLDPRNFSCCASGCILPHMDVQQIPEPSVEKTILSPLIWSFV